MKGKRILNPIGHSSRKRARIDSNLKRYYKPKLDLKLKFKEVITILALIMSVLVLFAVGKNSILAYFIDYKSINNYFIVEAEYIVSFDANTGTGTMENQESLDAEIERLKQEAIKEYLENKDKDEQED